MDTSSNKYFIFKKKNEARLKLKLSLYRGGHWPEKGGGCFEVIDLGPEPGSEAQGTHHCTILPPPFLSFLDCISHIGCK